MPHPGTSTRASTGRWRFWLSGLAPAFSPDADEWLVAEGVNSGKLGVCGFPSDENVVSAEAEVVNAALSYLRAWLVSQGFEAESTAAGGAG